MRGREVAVLAIAMVICAGPGAATISADPLPGDRYRCPRTDSDGLDTTRLEGKLLRRARVIADRHDCEIRVVERNGEPLAITDDYQHDRINVAVKHRRVTRVAGTF